MDRGQEDVCQEGRSAGQHPEQGEEIPADWAGLPEHEEEEGRVLVVRE